MKSAQPWENKLNWNIREDRIIAPAGYKAAAVAAGIKKRNGRLDLGLIFSEQPACAAAQFTTNVVKAAPVLLCQEHLEKSNHACRAILVNSGNANACTGDRGLEDSRRMALMAARILGISADQVLVSSTGVIGAFLPIERLEAKENELKIALNSEGLDAVAQAILTTDTKRKICTAEGKLAGKPIRICGMTKGAGMIHPRMATTLAFVLTDASISKTLLIKALQEACNKSYNRISVDGDTSTNDTLAVLANGASGTPFIDQTGEEYLQFVEGLTLVCGSLARQIVRDGEGASKFIEITVQHAGSEEAATQIARSIANSLLFKTAMAGEDANWGRILCAAGYSGISFDPYRVSIWIGGLKVCQNGTGVVFDEARAKSILRDHDIRILLDLQAGSASSTMWTCDLTSEYVHINADYRT
jgi:glutamate N-acetyltransferase/amino-acid N-acetyltransferase